ncbi:MAG: hypothetical protein RLP02_38585, partial [Coleofasciculus sp. C2-GNP5-27]
PVKEIQDWQHDVVGKKPDTKIHSYKVNLGAVTFSESNLSNIGSNGRQCPAIVAGILHAFTRWGGFQAIALFGSLENFNGQL